MAKVTFSSMAFKLLEWTTEFVFVLVFDLEWNEEPELTPTIKFSDEWETCPFSKLGLPVQRESQSGHLHVWKTNQSPR